MDENKDQLQSAFHSFTDNVGKSFLTPPVALLFLGTIVGGILVGYFVVSMQAKQAAKSGSVNGITSASNIQKGAVYGSDDTKTFKDMVEGTDTAGGINGEGQFHLVRPGGDSQNVYMTSSLVDLSLFVGRKIRVWGQTQKAKTAGWLMDVGRVEVLE